MKINHRPAGFQLSPNIPKPVWAVGFAIEQTLHVVALAVFSFLILKRLQHINSFYCFLFQVRISGSFVWNVKFSVLSLKRMRHFVPQVG
ncbi:MAG: hypothetical protein LBH59_08515 [Planctomycetaceae bacterium]|nr:hypothetical protein [Planctomycetaceae bacterium]